MLHLCVQCTSLSATFALPGPSDSPARCQQKWLYSRASLMNENNYARRARDPAVLYKSVHNRALCHDSNRDESQCLVWFSGDLGGAYMVDFIFE